MEELAYSLHLGSDKNKKNSVRVSAKNNKSGTTSMSNNAIQNAKQLSRVDKHNYRKYDNDDENIKIIKGTSSLYNDVKDLYIKEFEESRIKYNEKQIDTRKINNYFSHISNNAKNDLACEIIIELGDKKYWDSKDTIFKKKMTNVYMKQVEDLELMVPNFKVCSAIIHYDETSPHMHIVGVPIKNKSKYGMEKQVGKSDVFTKDSLRVLQDKMRILCIESFNKEYNLDNSLKPKLKGRNIDINVKDMDNYLLMKEELNKNQGKLIVAKDKSNELKEETKTIEKVLLELRPTITNKENIVLKKDDKDRLVNFISKVNETNDEYKNIQELSITLKDVDKELKDNKRQIKVLNQNINGLELRNKNLKEKLNSTTKELNEVKYENLNLKKILNSFKTKFNNLIKFINDRIFKSHNKDKYYDFAKELYTHDAISEEDIYEIKDNYLYSKEKESKSKKDDFQL